MSEPIPSRPGWFAALRPYSGVFLLATAFLVAAGTFSISRIPSGIYPEVAFPRIAVIASVPGLGIRSINASERSSFCNFNGDSDPLGKSL